METQNKIPEVETQNQAEQKSEIKKMSYKGVELSSDNKLTKEELKTIETLLVTDLKEIQQETQGKLEDLKNVIIEDLKARVDRNPEGKSTKYIKHLIERTESHLKIEKTEDKAKDQTPETPENQAPETPENQAPEKVASEAVSKITNGANNLVGSVVDSALNVAQRAKEMVIGKEENNLEDQIANANK